MPSGAKKRKAAKKKQNNNKQPDQHDLANDNSASQSQGSDGGDVRREVTEETSAKSRDQESSFAETTKEVNPSESGNVDASEEHKSCSNSSSSDYDEVDVQKDKPVVGVEDQMVKSDAVAPDVGPGVTGPGAGAQVVEETVHEGIPVEETVKEVVSSDPSAPDVVDSELNRPVFDEKEDGLFGVSDKGQEKVEADDNMARDVEDKSDGDVRVKETEKVQESGEQQALVSSVPPPVRRTLWMNCCGLFEVISGGSGR